MEIALSQEAITQQVAAQVMELNRLNLVMLELILQCETPVNYHGGQSILLLNHEHMGKSLPIASPGSAKTSGRIEIHVERIKGETVSEWIHDSLQVGDTITVCSPMGEMFYTLGKPQQPLLMVAWNGGLGAMIGVLQDAFENDHTGPVYLFHSVADASYLYYGDELKEIGEYYPNFRYLPCVAQGPLPNGCQSVSVDQIIQNSLPDLSGWKVFLCGAGDQIHQIQRQSYLAGAGMKDIYFEVTTI